MIRTVILGILSLWLVAAIVKQPDEAFQAALQGLSVWWNIVFPGLLPFLVLAELMLAFGALHAVSALVDPFMRRFAGLPGAAAWPLTLGWATGYTAGAEATAALRSKQAVSRAQAQWLLSVSCMPSPMFMFVVIGAGFLHSPSSGLFIALIVWISALIAAAAFRLQPGLRPAETDMLSFKRSIDAENPFKRAGRALMDGRRADGRSFGKALGDAVAGGVQKLMTIGGFMIVCSLLARLLQLSLPRQWEFLSFTGIYESHLGAYSASQLQSTAGTPVMLAAIAAVLSWGGWSGLLQVRSTCSDTDLKFLPFVISRFIHAVVAFGSSLLLWDPFLKLLAAIGGSPVTAAFTQGSPVSAFPRAVMDEPIHAQELPSLWPHVHIVFAAIGILTLGLIFLSYATWLSNRRRSA